VLARFERLHAGVVAALVLLTTAFALYTGAVGPYEAPIQRGVFVLLMLPLVFLLTRSGLGWRGAAEHAFNFALSLAAVAVMAWYLWHYERLYSAPFVWPSDIAFGMVGIALVLEAVRRTVGLPITAIIIAFLIFAYFGPQVPVRVLRHGGLDAETMVSMIFFGTDGVFGTPIGVCATFIVVIMMFGALLMATGGAELFMNIAKIVAGRFVGGPAKIAVVGSAMMGMITGATVANVATTGPVTIPMMKRAGYDPRFAGAVEALASSGGQLMPPIMGAAAFIMIDYLNISYAQLVSHAIIPALLYFASVLLIVHVRSVKYGFKPIPKAEIPKLKDELKRRGHMLLPLVVLIYMLSERYSIMYVAFFTVVTTIAVSFLRRETRLGLAGFMAAFRDAITSMVPLVAICAGAGVLIGVLTATGVNLKITYLIEYVAQGSLFVTLLLTMVACIILGMGLPTVAAYIVLATLVPASLINLGVLPVAAHLFIFYFAILSAITPPVCTGAYVAAGIAQTDPIQTGIAAIRLGIVVFLLPFAFVYDPALLLLGSWGEVAFFVGTSALGIVFWAYGLEGWLGGAIGWPARVALLASGALLIWPDVLMSGIGLVIGLGALTPSLMRRYNGRRGSVAIN